MLSGHNPSVKESCRTSWEMFGFLTTYYYFLACDWNPNGYAASASIIFVNRVLSNTLWMSWYFLVLCIVISQCLHCTLVLFFMDPFPCSFIKLKRFHHYCFECSVFSNHGHKSTDILLMIFSQFFWLLFEGYSHIFMFILFSLHPSCSMIIPVLNVYGC